METFSDQPGNPRQPEKGGPSGFAAGVTVRPSVYVAAMDLF